MASRSLDDLAPDVREEAKLIVREWRAMNMDVLITCTFRSNEEQDRLYAQGRGAPGNIVTNARAGESLHNVGRAIDFVPLVHGKPDWEDLKRFEIVARVAQRVDPRVRWGGDWSGRLRDYPHIEWPKRRDVNLLADTESGGSSTAEA